MDGALDKHSKVGVEVGDAGFQSSDVPTDSLDLLHEESFCEVGRAHRSAQKSKASSELDVSGDSDVGDRSLLNRVGGDSGFDLKGQGWVESAKSGKDGDAGARC